MAPPQPPGWYPDDGDQAALRYWDGAAWTGERRPRPSWTGAPVEELESAPGQPPPANRRRWIVLASVGLLAAVALGVGMEAIKAPSPGRRVLTDAAFVNQANDLCQNTLPGLRPLDSGPFGASQTPAQTADRIDQVAAGIDGLAQRLRGLPAAAVDRPHLDGWFDSWARFAADGRAYAGFLRQFGFKRPGPILDRSARDQHQADNFALANSLKRCTFFAVYQPNPANGL